MYLNIHNNYRMGLRLLGLLRFIYESILTLFEMGVSTWFLHL